MIADKVRNFYPLGSYYKTTKLYAKGTWLCTECEKKKIDPRVWWMI